MEDNFFYSKTINGETHLKMLSEKDDSFTKGYEEITMKDYMEVLNKIQKPKPQTEIKTETETK